MQGAIEAQLRQPKAPWLAQAREPARLQSPGLPLRNNPAIKPKPPASRTSPSANAPIPRLPATRHVVKGRPAKAPSRPRPEPEPPKPFEYWELPSEAPVRETPPQSVSPKDRADFENLIAAGATPSPSETGEDLFAIIGLDFGTAWTKVIVRFPYESEQPTVAIPAPPHCRSKDHPYLWHTVLWAKKNGDFIAWPESDARPLHSLKQGIMAGRANDIVLKELGGSLGVTKADAATAFLAFVIRYVRGWLAANRPNLFRQRRSVWFVNVGLPAESADTPGLASEYRKVAAAALLLANLGGRISVEETRACLTAPNVAGCTDSAERAEAFGIAIIPETAAEVAGFAKSTNRAPGVYLMVDVGAMTLDVCAFRLQQRQSLADRYNLFKARVRPLGVEAFYWFREHGKTEDGFKEQCDRCCREVVWDTKMSRDPRAECWRKGNALPVFLAGGGSQNELHRQRIEALGPWLRENTENDGIHLLNLPEPANIDRPVHLPDFGRLGVAWGLSFPPNEIGEVIPPSLIEDIPTRKPRNLDGRFVSKDHV